MQMRWATRYRCDGCGTEADVATPMGPITRPEQPMPAGWLRGFRFERYVGPPVSVITELCGTCGAMSFGDLLAMLEGRDSDGARDHERAAAG